MKTKTILTAFCSISIMLSSFLFTADFLFSAQKRENVTREAVSALEQGRAYHDRGDYRQAIRKHQCFTS